MSIQSSVNQVINTAAIMNQLRLQTEDSKQKAQQHQYQKRTEAFNLEKQRLEAPTDNPLEAMINQQQLGRLKENFASYQESQGDYIGAGQTLYQPIKQNLSKQALAQTSSNVMGKMQQKNAFSQLHDNMLNDFESWTKERGM